jgi:hypothetical protein
VRPPEFVRRMGPPLGVARARLASRPGGSLLVVAGIAVATALLVGLLGGGLLARDRALQQTLADLPEDQQSIRVDLFGLPVQQNLERADRTVREALSILTPGPPLRVVYFRDWWLDGEFVRLVALDGLAELVRLRSGRLPRSCRPEACEVVQIGENGRRVLREGGINLVRVGVGELGDTARYGPAFQRLREYRAQGSLVRSVVLLAPSVPALEQLGPLQLLFRVRSWIAPLDTSRLRAWQVEATLEQETRAQAKLQEADPAYALSGPDSALIEARERGEVSGRRLLLIGGGASAALLIFALTAAVGLRRGLAAERRRLLERGATTTQAWLAAVSEVALLTFVGWILGVVIGAAAVATLAERLDLAAGATLWHALLEPRTALALSLALLVTTCAILGATVVSRERSHEPRVRLLDVAGVCAAVTVALGVSLGGLSRDDLASEDGSAFLLALPWLVCLVGGIAAFRLLTPLMRLGERLARGAPIALRLGLLALARTRAQSALAGTSLVVALGLALFALSYRSTLERGAGDESAFSVPLDVTLSAGARLALPLDVASLAEYKRLGSGVRAYPILRRWADVAGIGNTQSVMVLGLPPSAFAQLDWRSDFSPQPRSELGGRLYADGEATLHGIPIPGDAASLSLGVRHRGIALHIDLALQDERGRIEAVFLGRVSAGRSVLEARLPPDRGGGRRRLVALELSLPTAERNWQYHLANEGRTVVAPSGSLSLEALVAKTSAGHSRVIHRWRGWALRDAHGADEPARGLPHVDYVFRETTTLVVRPRQPTDGRPLKLIASPDLARGAGPDGRLVLNFYDPAVSARIVGVARRFPTIPADEPFVLVDASRLATALNADAPGTADPGELWLSVPREMRRTVGEKLHRPRLAKLDLLSRETLLERLTQDPFARATTLTLGVSGLLALVLAAVGLWFTLVAQMRDEERDLFDLEAQGVAPETLRSHVRVRAYALLGYGLAGGLALGFALSRVVVSLVQVSAPTTSPEPPLLFAADWVEIMGALGGFVLACVLIAEASVRHSFRADTPLRPTSWSLE